MKKKNENIYEGDLIIRKVSEWEKYKQYTKITGSLYLRGTQIPSKKYKKTIFRFLTQTENVG